MGGVRARGSVVAVAATVAALVLAIGALAARTRCDGGVCRGSKGPDRISGSPKADKIKALGGKDKVRAKGGNDKAFGEKGADQLAGEGGKDQLHGGAEADR